MLKGVVILAFDVNEYMNAIVKKKEEWADADKSGNTELKNSIAASAQDYYKKLRDNGYTQVANHLGASDLDAAKKYVSDYIKTAGKTAIRPYYYEKGKKYGLSQSDIDSAISYNAKTGEVSLGGKNIGTPYSEVDGVSYWDSEVLDTAFDDYINRSGIARSKETAVNQENENLFQNYKKQLGYLEDVNPLETELGKSIIGNYNIKAMQEGVNGAAASAASNGGNIDSFSAANAMRQQAAMITEGQKVALDAHQQRVDNVRNILSDLGVHIDRVYNQDETSKNNETARLSEQASVTGYVPKQWQYANNPYFNSDGTLNDVYTSSDFDATGGFTTIIDNAKKKLATTTDASERANLEATIKFATQAKAYKTLQDPKYAQYAHEVEAVSQDKTAEYDTNLKSIESAERISHNTNQTNLQMAQIDAATQKALAQWGYEQTIDKANLDNASAKELLQMQIIAAAQGENDTGYQLLMNTFSGAGKLGVRDFIDDVLLPTISENEGYVHSDIGDLISSKAKPYGIQAEDAKKLCELFAVDYSTYVDSSRLSSDGKYLLKEVEDKKLEAALNDNNTYESFLD